MKENENNYYSENAQQLLSGEDYRREMNRLEAENKAKAKYEADAKTMAEIKRKEAVKKDTENKAREKEKADREARIEFRNQIKKTEAENREYLKKQREKAEKNFDKLDTDEMVLLLNDGADMGTFYGTMFMDGYNDYVKPGSTLKEEFDALPKLGPNISEEDLKKTDILFHKLFGDLADLEKPFLTALNNDQVPTDIHKMDSMIAANFVHDIISNSVANRVDYILKGAVKDPDTLMRYQKLYVLNAVANNYKQLESKIEDLGTLNDVKELDPVKDKDAIEEFNNKREALIKDFSTRMGYKSFYAERSTDGKLEVIRPALDYNPDTRVRKRWLREHPEKEGVNYLKDDLDFQLTFAKLVVGGIAKEQNLPESIYSEANKGRTPQSLNRAKYELREIRGAFMAQAEKKNIDSTLRKFNEDMAKIADYEAGDFRRLIREKPHMANLLDVIINGPLCTPQEGKTQEQIYKELSDIDSDALRDYMTYTHSIVNEIDAEYKKQKLADANFDPEMEKEIKQDIIDASDGLYTAVSHLSDKTFRLKSFDKYCAKPISKAFDKREKTNVIEDSKIISSEVSALYRGWNMKDTFIFAMVGSTYNKARELYSKDEKKYEALYDEIGKIYRKMDTVKTAVDKRNCLRMFEDFVRNNIDDKELVGAIADNQVLYDSVRDDFEKGYKDAVKADLKKLEDNPAKLAQTMVNMQKIALKNEEDFHTEIFKEYINEMGADKQTELQKAIYNERLNQMINRGKRVWTESEAIYKRDELGGFKYNPSVRKDIISQIGRLASEKDEVASADKLSELFAKPLSDEAKENIEEDFKNKVIYSQDLKIDGKVYHDQKFYEMEMAKLVENTKPSHNFTVVEAPEGGYNIRYDKDILEIKKDVLEKTDAQFEDIKLELAKIKNGYNEFMMEMSEGWGGNVRMDHYKYAYANRDSNLYKYIDKVVSESDYTDLRSFVDKINDINEEVDKTIKRAQNSDKKEELELLRKIKNHTNKCLDTLKPENYPDVDFSSSQRIFDYKKELEVTKILWENHKEGNKWEPKPTEFVKKKQAENKKDPLNNYYKALANDPTIKELELNDEYRGMLKDSFNSRSNMVVHLTPYMIHQMCERYFNALRALDGDDVSKESKQYQEFYYSLKDLKDHYFGKEVSQEDGSLVAQDCLHDLQLSIKNYLNSNDNSKNAPHRRNVAGQIVNIYLNPNGKDMVAQFDDWISKDEDVKKSIANLSPEAKKKRETRLEAEKKAADEILNLKKIEAEKEKKLTEEVKKVNNNISAKEKLIKEKEKWLADGYDGFKHDMWVANKNLSNAIDNAAKNKYKTRIAELKKQEEVTKSEIADAKDALAKLKAQKQKLYVTYAPKEVVEKHELKRREVKDIMMGKKPDPKKKAAPKKEEPKNVAPKKEGPKKTAPKKEVPKKVEEPKKAVPKKEEPKKKKEEPKVEEPKKAAPKKEEPKKVVPKEEPKIINIDNEANNSFRIDELENDNIRINDAPKDQKKSMKEEELKEAPKKEEEAPKEAPKKAEKAPKKGKLPVSYESYMKLHTGEHMGKNHKTMVDNFAKVIAAYSLRANGIKFSVDKIHDYVDVMKDNLCLDDLSDDVLRQNLKSMKTAILSGDAIRNEMYKVDDIEGFRKDMEELKKNMLDSKKRSDEYIDLVRCVDRVINLKNKENEFKNPEERQTAYNQAAFLVTFGATNYMKGKKKVRTTDDGKYRFDNALDALAIVSKHAPKSEQRIDKVIDRINYVRGKKEPIDKGTFKQTYGVNHAEAAKHARDAKKGLNK